jgi:DivIVA domain-containing protein
LSLDRQSIEKKDFPIGRRGYDPDAVDAHLARIAEEVEGLSSEPSKSPSLASTAGERIQAIVDAAERTAAEIEKQAADESSALRKEAEAESRQVREQADADAARTREEATAESREHVAQVMEGTAAMRTRVEAMETELASMLESLKTGTNRVTSDLELLHGSMTGLGGAAAPGAVPTRDDEERETVAPPVPAAEEADEPEIVEEEILETEVVVEVEPEGDGGSDEVEGARLVALNMALNGTPREETQQYLQENFSLEDQDALLDEVYATVGEG